MDSVELAEEITKLNLNPEHTNTNHDQKLVNFFYHLQRSGKLNLTEVKTMTESLSGDYSEEMRKQIDDIAYFVSLIR